MENNILIFSDLHINDYANYNSYRESRLLQTRILSDLLLEAGRENSCDRFIIAGDVTEVPVMKTTVLNEIKFLFNKLCSFFNKDNYIIYGQHDLSTKDNEQDPRFSGLTALLPENLYYADKRQWNLCNRKVAMMNWRPVQDLSWINGKVDLFVGHVTLAPIGSQYKGQDIDRSKFELGITGDIHKHFSIGNMVSIGSCVQNKLGDQPKSTAIVWNPNDNSWKCIDIDPNNRLLRLRYTKDKDKEGFDTNENYYNVYRPALLDKNDSDVINIPKWAEINELVNRIIKDNNLDIIHNEVLKNCKFDDDVDFNFIPLKLKLKNFRSIDFAEIYFDDSDKISISGNNGSGKSSLILGLYNALRENRSLKDFIKFGADSCECEIEFIYQGTNNRILRGTKDYGCWINGEKLPYNNKREFEDDMLKRYSFLNYVDIYFFNADRSTILGSLSPERKSEVISKLFRINKIDSYNSTSLSMYNELAKSIESKLTEYEKVSEITKYLKDKISSIVIPNRSLDELQKIHSSMISEQKEYYEFLENKSGIEKIQGMIDSCTNQINSNKLELESIDLDSLEKEKSDILSELEKLRKLDSEYSEMNKDRAMIKNSLDLVLRSGRDAYNQLMSVRSGVCPTCGSKVVLIDLEDKLGKQVDNLMKEKDLLTFRLEEIDKSMKSIDLNKIKSDINEKESRFGYIDREVFRYESLKLGINKLNKSVLEYSKKKSEYLSERSYSVKSLPEDFYDVLNNINLEISSWKTYIDLENQISLNIKKEESMKDEIENFKSNLSILNKYIKLTSSTGDIYKEIMTRISKDFSDNTIRYEVNQYKFRNKDHLDLDVQYNVKGRWIGYQSLSSGQKTMADINFLSRILVECGLLVFDETLKHLSPSSTEYCLDIMKRMNVHTMILTSHAYGTEFFSNKELSLNLDEKGITKINIR